MPVRIAKVPSGAPRVRDWYVEREAVVAKACDRLCIASSSSSSSLQEPRMVGLAGPAGAGKSTAASMVVAREDVRASFYKGVLWLPVGQGAKGRLPTLMHRLAKMVYNTVLEKSCRPPLQKTAVVDPEDGAAYIREVVDEDSRRYLVVADDVWEAEVLEELERAGAWVLYTSRSGNMRGDPPLRLDQVLPDEAEIVLRRAADLDDDARLPPAAYELMEACGFCVLDLAFVGRWGAVRGNSGERAWRTAFDNIDREGKSGQQGGQCLPWRTAALRAGLEELATDSTQNKELYISLAVLPKGLAFALEDAAALLYGEGCSDEDVQAAKRPVVSLERWSILTMKGWGGMYHVHDAHADFLRESLTTHPVTRDRALRRWQRHVSTLHTLLTRASEELVEI